MRLGLTTALVVICLASAAGARAADCDNTFRFSPNDRLSVQEIAGLVDADSSDGPKNTVLVARPTDWEEAEARGPWILWGVIYGGFVGEGGKLAGGVLWVRSREAFGTGGGSEFRKGARQISLTIKPNPDTPIRGCRGGLHVTLDDRGVMRVQGKIVGRARETN